jgi:hypothetical protein
MKFAFLDAEFTGEHAKTTLVSVGLVGLDGGSLSVTFNDYDRDQVTPWLQENVLEFIDETQSVSGTEGYRIVSEWLESYSGGEQISLVSAGKLSDILLVFELWHHAFPEEQYFHHLHLLPAYLNHSAHFDLPTIFFLAGLDPDLDRESFAGQGVPGLRHEALHDACVVRQCFLQCVTPAAFPGLDPGILANLRPR